MCLTSQKTAPDAPDAFLSLGVIVEEGRGVNLYLKPMIIGR